MISQINSNDYLKKIITINSTQPFPKILKRTLPNSLWSNNTMIINLEKLIRGKKKKLQPNNPHEHRHTNTHAQKN